MITAVFSLFRSMKKELPLIFHFATTPFSYISSVVSGQTDQSDLFFSIITDLPEIF